MNRRHFYTFLGIIFIIIMVLMPSLNILYYGSFIRYICLMFLVCYSVFKLHNAQIYVFDIVGGVFVFFIVVCGSNIVKAVMCTLLFFSIKYVIRDINVLKKSLLILVFVHVFLSVNQLLGTNDLFYNHVTYSNFEMNGAKFIGFDCIDAKYLPQIRPSGLFPAPTYVSYFLILMYALITQNFTRHRFLVALFAISLVISGSTMGFLLMVLYVLFSAKGTERYFFLFVVAITTVIYSAFIPSIFSYNFSIHDLYHSIINRSLAESIITTRPALVFAIMVLTLPFLLFHLVPLLRNFRLLLSPAVLIFMPTLLHDGLNSLFGIFIFSFGYYMAVNIIKSYRYTTHLVPRNIIFFKKCVLRVNR